MRNRKWPVDFVGVLAEEGDVEGKNSVFVNNSNTIQFYVKIISDEPESFPRNVKIVTCFANELFKWGFEDDTLIFDDDKRIESLREFLRDSLLVFQPELRIGANFKEYYIATNVTLIGKKESFTEKTKLSPIPVFKEKDDVGEGEFQEKLANQKYIGNNEHISSEEEDTPLFLIWENKTGDQTIYGEFLSHSTAHGGFRFELKDKQLRKLPLKPEWQEEIYFVNDVGFLPAEIYEEIAELLPNSKPVSLPEPMVKPVEEKQEVAIIESSAEEAFLQEFKEETRKMGLFYHENDLYNFHTAMKTKSLVILAGMSGTGKSQIVNAYARALGLPASQVNIIPVRPSWTDDTDLLGYPDTLNNVYRPGDSGLVNTLIRAENDPQNLYVVCFDEMNLARVEHYFAQFLSVLEMEEGRKNLKLYNQDLQHRFYNGDQYKPEITIKENVLFVGTVNIDESTHHFSDKVLDRSNVIELKIMPYEHLLSIEDKKEIKRKEKETISTEDYNQFRNQNFRSVDLTKQELAFLWDLHNVLQETSIKMGIGPRVVRQIDRYIKNLPASCPFSRGDALDIQVLQRILTKVRGAEDLLIDLLGTFIPTEETVSGSKIFEVFDRYKEVSDFYQARVAVIEKAKELRRNGYTI